MKEKFNYTLGLDIGTGSVGWAVFDNEKYDVPTFRGRNAYGSVIFNSAETAENTRLKRNARRGYRRRVRRIQLLQELFAPIINNPGFFRITNNKKTWRNSNDFENRTLSEVLLEVGFTKEEIQERFPTIYHLRDEILNKNEKIDLRLIYLAIHNLVKYRGHFLLQGVNWQARDLENNKQNFEKLFQALNTAIKTPDRDYRNIDVEKVIAILNNDQQTKNDRNKELTTELGQFKPLSRLLLGLSTTLSTLFAKSENVEMLKESKLKFDISKEDEENEEKVYNALTEEQAEVLDYAREIYSEVLLNSILGSHNSIAEAKVEAYNQFKKELKNLKDKIYQNYGLEVGHELFKSTREALNDFQEIPSSSNLKKLCYFDQMRLDRVSKQKGSSRGNFINRLKKIDTDKKCTEEIELMEDNMYLSFLNTTDNSVIPNQNNVYEATTILKNQQKYHKEITDDLIKQVELLISFRIPYFVGPLIKNEEQSKFAWMSRLNNDRITPFNFDDVVDKSRSASDFIKRMTGKCTFILEEDVLPSHSLLYQEMNVINELANIKIAEKGIDGKDIFINLNKNELETIIERLFKKTKTVKLKRFKDILQKEFNYSDDIYILGLSNKDEFNSNLSSYIDFERIIGEEKLNNHREEVEMIIEWLSIFNEKNIIHTKIKDNFGEWITQEEINKILSLSYSGWGNVSKRVLKLKSNGETVIEIMRETPCNMMAAINNKKYDFKEEIEGINKEFINKDQDDNKKYITYNDIKDLKGSPSIKKGIWMSVRVVEEVIKVFGKPTNIVLEFSRGEEEKESPKTWAKKWEKTIKDNKLKNTEQFEKVYKEFNKNKDTFNFNNERIRLYLLQGGKCLYTKERIDLNSLLNKNNELYDVDHILPRSFVKDDSIDNKALVLSKVNSRKSDVSTPLQVIKEEKRPEIKAFWKFLYENGQMSQLKYFRLMKEEFTDTDKERFIARQLVETRQILVHVKNLLEERFKNEVNIVPMSYQMTDEIRKSMDIPKIRDLNDYHHAVDALLVAMAYQFSVDTTEDGKTNIFHFDMRKHKAEQKWKRLRKLQERDNYKNKKDKKELFLVRKMRKKTIKNDQTLEEIVEKIIDGKEPIATRMPGSKASAFYNETIYSPKEAGKDLSDKIIINEKHYFTNVNNDGIIILEKTERDINNEKTTKINILENIRVLDRYNADVYNNKEYEDYLINQERFISKNKELQDIKIGLIIEEQTKVIFEDELFYLSSASELLNAKQLWLNLDFLRELNNQYRYKFNVNKAEKIYNEFLDIVISEYSHWFTGKKEQKENKIEILKKAFEESNQTQEDFRNWIDELLKVVSPSSSRSKYAGRRNSINQKDFISEAKIVYESITGLYYKKPKYIHKFLE